MQSGLRETSSWAQWGLVGHSVIQQPPLYLLSISPELWAAWAQSKAPATHGSQSRAGRGHGPGSLISPSEPGSTFTSSSLGGLHLAPALGPSEAFCPLAQPLSCRLEARPPLLVASLCALGVPPDPSAGIRPNPMELRLTLPLGGLTATVFPRK